MVYSKLKGFEQLDKGAAAVKKDKDIVIAVAGSKLATEWHNKQTKWSAFVAWLSQPRDAGATFEEYKKATKERKNEIKNGPSFVGGPLKEGKRSSQSVQQRFIIALDIDDARPDLLTKLEQDFDFTSFYYSTLSHKTTGESKYRIIIPLERSVTPTEYEALTRKIAELLGAEQFDPSTVQPERLMFSPAKLQGGPFEHKHIDKGKFLDPDEVLDYYTDWTDRSEWAMLGDERRVITDRQKKLGDPREKRNTIGAFCKAYTISEAIETFLPDIYKHVGTNHEGEERYSYIPGKGSSGALVYDDTFLHSFHGTDPVSGRSVNAFDLVRLHLFGDEDAGSTPETPTTDLPSYKAMIEYAQADPKVAKILRERATDVAKEEFGTWMPGGGEVGTWTPVGDGDDEITDLDVEQETEEPTPDNDPQHWLELNKNGGVKKVYTKVLAERVAEEIEVAYDGKDLYSYIADEGIWKHDTVALLRSYIANEKLKGLANNNLVSDTLKMLQDTVYSSDIGINERNLNKVVLNNGVYDLIEGSFTPEFDKDLYATSKHPIDYDPAAECPTFIDFLEFAVGPENIEFVFEWFGYNLYRSYEVINAILFIHGRGGTGKSTLVRVLTEMLGADNTASIPISTLMEERFAKASLYLKNANMDTDAEPKYLADGSTLKQLTGEDKLFADRKNREPIQFTSFAKLTFAMNELPPMRDFSGGLERRMLILPMNNKITDEAIEQFPIDVIMQELPGIFNEATKRLPGLLKRKEFTVSQAMKKEVENWVSGNDVTSLFIEDECEIAFDEYTPVKELYSDYVRYCKSSGYRSMSRNKFKQRLEDLKYEQAVRRIGGKSTKVWLDILGPTSAGLDF